MKTLSIKSVLFTILLSLPLVAKSAYILVQMDHEQRNHLKAYGITYWALENGVEADWLLNYRGGSFMMKHYQKIENELIVRGVSYTVISDAESNQIITQIASPSSNTDVMKLQKAPKIAVYSPQSKMPLDDEVMQGELPKYDWLHLHHEDFTGQYGKFYELYRYAPWYQEQQREYEAMARKYGYSKVSDLKLGVVHKIRDFVSGGGFLFAMCSATDTDRKSV